MVKFKDDLTQKPCQMLTLTDSQKWSLQKSASDYEVKIELGPVLAQFRANLSFAAPKMLLSGL